MPRATLGNTSITRRWCRGILSIAAASVAWASSAVSQGVIFDANDDPAIVATAAAWSPGVVANTGGTDPCGVGNCPRTPGFWSQQCEQRGGGSTKFSAAQMAQITGAIDQRSSFFSWSNDFESFCANVNPSSPMDPRKQAKRHFVALLANVAAGELDIRAGNGETVSLNLGTRISCGGVTSNTIGGLIQETDAALAKLEGKDLTGSVRDKYSALLSCLDAINNGRGIGATCTSGGGGGTPPVCTITGPSSVCSGNPIQLCGPDEAGLTYEWNTGAKTRCITVSSPGVYTLTLRRGSCAPVSCSKKVTSSTSECTITGPSTICAGNPVQLCGPPEAPGRTYLWSTGETTRCISVTAQATYTLTVGGGACGPVTCSKELLASSPPTCTITGPSSLCPGQSATLCAPEGFQGTQFTYLWNTGQTTRCININKPGDYTVTVSTPECGKATCTKTVSLGSTIACSISGPTDIDPDSTAQLCGPQGADLTYLWSTGETTRCITIDGPGKYVLTVTSPTCGSSTCTRVVVDQPTSSCRCTIGYPDASNPPRSQQTFIETAILRAVVPGADGCPIGEQTLRLWYNDTDALGLGIRQVVVYTSPTDSTVTNYPVTPSPASPACVANPQFGATAQTGLQTGNDVAVGGGRPIWPVLFITDITLDKDARDGDWQQDGAAGIPADQVCGVWTTGVRRVLAYAGNQTIIRMDPDPAANGWNLGAGSDVPPGGFGAYPDEGYGAEVSWDLTSLGLVPGHRYRLYTMIHDGSQSNTTGGGNVGHACTRVQVAQNGAILPLGDGEGDDLAAYDVNGATVKNGAARASAAGLPAQFELAQNVPNPFAAGSRTALRFSLPERSNVRIAVYTVAGQRVSTLAEGSFEAGHRTVEWTGLASNGRMLAPGMYVCKMEASAAATGRFVTVRKMLMVK